jgi:CRP-like cAMP-binding protein
VVGKSNSARHRSPASVAARSDTTTDGDDLLAEIVQERNRILRRLPAIEYDRLVPHLEPIDVQALEVLEEADQPLRYAYFSQTALISVLRRMRNGTLIEAGVIGGEGMAGLPLVFGEEWSPVTLAGQVPGACKRIPFAVLRDLLPELPVLGDLLRRFALSFLDLVGQSAACNGMHPVEKRCARWLLMTQERVGRDQFQLTQAVLAQMLAVRRAGVSEAAGALQRANLIRYSRGLVTILDRAGLEAASCECYGIVRAHFERLLGEEGIVGP